MLASPFTVKMECILLAVSPSPTLPSPFIIKALDLPPVVTLTAFALLPAVPTLTKRPLSSLCVPAFAIVAKNFPLVESPDTVSKP